MDNITGKKITQIRLMTKQEMSENAWYGQPAPVLVLEDGTILYPSKDPEGNGPGVIFGKSKDGFITIG